MAVFDMVKGISQGGNSLECRRIVCAPMIALFENRAYELGSLYLVRWDALSVGKMTYVLDRHMKTH